MIQRLNPLDQVSDTKKKGELSGTEFSSIFQKHRAFLVQRPPVYHATDSSNQTGSISSSL